MSLVQIGTSDIFKWEHSGTQPNLCMHFVIRINVCFYLFYLFLYKMRVFLLQSLTYIYIYMCVFIYIQIYIDIDIDIDIYRERETHICLLPPFSSSFSAASFFSSLFPTSLLQFCLLNKPINSKSPVTRQASNPGTLNLQVSY